MKGAKEDVVLKGCLEYLKLKNIFCFRNNTGAVKVGRRFVRFGCTGSSDILGILPDGRFLAVECKREKGGVLSEAQKDFLEKININNGVAFCVHSVIELDEKLKKYNF